MLLLMSWMIVAQAQEQESKLLQRMLKPDMSLQNSAQGKSFHARSSTTNKPAYVKNFYTPGGSIARPYSSVKIASTRDFPSHDYVSKKPALGLSLAPNAQREFTTTPARHISETWDANKSVASSRYAGERPFLERGKSQKALNTQNLPLTIDQVRELLNKNK